MKKIYRKPELKVKKIELGVFGSYGGDDKRVDPSPVGAIGDLRFHMEQVTVSDYKDKNRASRLDGPIFIQKFGFYSSIKPQLLILLEKQIRPKPEKEKFDDGDDA